MSARHDTRHLVPRREALPEALVNLADHEARARNALDDDTLAYVSGGAGDEVTLRANRTAWDSLSLVPRVLRVTGAVDTRVTLLGQTYPWPLLVAPMAWQTLVHQDGESATALAAAALGVGMILGMQSSTPLEQIARMVLADAERGPLWFQLYGGNDRVWMLELATRAHSAGYEALVVTIDAPVNGVRDRERRAAFVLPKDLRGAHPASPHATAHLGWADIEWLVQHTPLPVLLKGITHPLDARQACTLGVAGLVVSNHGGRVLDGVPATAHLLPEVADAVADAGRGRCVVLVDGGIRRGTDVLKALALGAHAVLLGRPVLYGLANAGAAGVAHVLRLLQDETLAALLLSGCARVADVDRGLLAHVSAEQNAAHAANAMERRA